MKSTWKAVAAALVLIGSMALAQDAPAQAALRQSPASDKTASDKATSTTSLPLPPAPAGPEYVIGPEDVLHVAVWKETDLTATLPVRPDGKISLPLLDDVQASGLTPKQLAESVTEKLKKYIADPRVTVVVTTINSKRIYLVGEVMHPGATRDAAQHDRSASIVQRRIKPVCQHQAAFTFCVPKTASSRNCR